MIIPLSPSVTLAGNSKSGSSAAILSAAARPFEGANSAQLVPSDEQPSVQSVVVTDMPLGSQTDCVPAAHFSAPGVQPHRSGGHSGGVTVQTFFSPPDSEYSPF